MVSLELNKSTILDFLNDHAAELQVFKVQKIGLFGSYFRNEQTEASDIDLLVEYEKGGKSLGNFLGLIDFLEVNLGKEVELVTKEALSSYLLPYVLKEVE